MIVSRSDLLDTTRGAKSSAMSPFSLALFVRHMRSVYVCLSRACLPAGEGSYLELEEQSLVDGLNCRPRLWPIVSNKVLANVGSCSGSGHDDCDGFNPVDE